MLEFTKTVRGKEALDVLISVLKRGFKGRGLVSDKYIYTQMNVSGCSISLHFYYIFIQQVDLVAHVHVFFLGGGCSF